MAAAQRHTAEARASPSRATCGCRAGARRNSRRGAGPARRPMRLECRHRAIESHPLLLEKRRLREIGGGKMRVDGLEIERAGSRARRASCARGCRTETRVGSCQYRSSNGSAAGRRARRRPRRAPWPRPARTRSASARSQTRPARSLMLSAPNTRTGIDTPARRSVTPSSISAHASIDAPAASSASPTRSAPCPYALALTTAMIAGGPGGRGLFRGSTALARQQLLHHAKIGLNGLQADGGDGGTNHLRLRGLPPRTMSRSLAGTPGARAARTLTPHGLTA